MKFKSGEEVLGKGQQVEGLEECCMLPPPAGFGAEPRPLWMH